MSQFETLCSSFEGLHSRSEVPGIGTLASGFVAWCCESHKPGTKTHPVSLALGYSLENTQVFSWTSDLVLKCN